jgi:DNA-3-methyladenine glycosylase I
MTYCEVAAADPFHRTYHHEEYGFPVRDDAALFERLVLEINQAGLSWLTILKKRSGFRRAYDSFDLERVAGYDEADRTRLLTDSGVIRNRLKIDAAIVNARRILELRQAHGSFAEWLNLHHPQPLDGWRKLFKKTFVFTGGEIVREFLLSTGYLPGAHVESCPVYARILDLHPPWLIPRPDTFRRIGGHDPAGSVER